MRSGNYAAAVICLRTNDARFAHNAEEATVLSVRVQEIIRSVCCASVIAIGPIGFGNKTRLDVIEMAIANAVAATGPPICAIYARPSVAPREFYRKSDPPHLTPLGRKAIASTLEPKIQKLLSPRTGGIARATRRQKYRRRALSDFDMSGALFRATYKKCDA